MRRLRMIVPVVVLVMVAAACAGDDDTSEPTGTGQAPEPPRTICRTPAT